MRAACSQVRLPGKQEALGEACKREEFVCSRMLAVDKVSK